MPISRSSLPSASRVNHAATFWLRVHQCCIFVPPSPPRAPLLGRHYPPSSLLLAHAPLLMPLTSISFVVIRGALAARAIHGWSSGASRLYSADLSQSATSPTPAVCRMHLTSSSPTASAFATFGQARLPAILHKRVPVGHPFRGCRHSLMLWPSSLLARLLARYNLDSVFGLQSPGFNSLSFLEDSLPPPQSSLLRG
jgi:hypothetical protein